MKYFMLCLLAILLLTVTGCNNIENEATTNSEIGDSQSDTPNGIQESGFYSCESKISGDEEPVYYTAKDMDGFFAEFSRIQANRNDTENISGSGSARLVLTPVLKSDQWKLWLCEILSHERYGFYYVPIMYDKAHFDYKQGFYVGFSSSSYDLHVERYNLVSVDGMAYDAERRQLFIELEQGMIAIYIPETIGAFDPTQINEYFSFVECGSSSEESLATE